MEHAYSSTLKREEHYLLLTDFKYTQFYTMPRDRIGLLHVRLCGKPTSTTRTGQSLLYASRLPLGIG